MSTWDKLIARIIKLDKNISFEDVKKVLIGIGYTCRQPKSGSRHYIFRKDGAPNICIPNHGTVKVTYIKEVKQAIEGEEDEKRS